MIGIFLQDFNALNYQHSHFDISRNEYIRTKLDIYFFVIFKITLHTIEIRGWYMADHEL